MVTPNREWGGRKGRSIPYAPGAVGWGLWCGVGVVAWCRFAAGWGWPWFAGEARVVAGGPKAAVSYGLGH